MPVVGFLFSQLKFYFKFFLIAGKAAYIFQLKQFYIKLRKYYVFIVTIILAVISFLKMLLCQENGCADFYHRLLHCMEQGLNNEARVLLQYVKDFRDVVDESGQTLLHYSIQYDNEAMVSHVVEKGCEINAQDSSGATPIMLAINVKNVTIVEILCQNDVDLFITNRNGVSTLELSLYGSLNAVPSISLIQNSKIISEILFEKINKDFLTRKDVLVKLLLDTNPIIKLACVVFGSYELTKFILENCYEVDFRESKKGFSAFDCALVLARFEKAELLIQLGASVKLLNNDGDTLLYYYRQFEYLDIHSHLLKMILSCSIDLYVPNRNGFTGVKYLLLFGNKKIVRTVIQSNVEMVESLTGRTLLHLLIENLNLEVTDIIELGISVDVNARDLENMSPLFAAASLGHLHKVEFLLKHGVGKNASNEELNWALANSVMYSNCTSEDRIKIAEHLLHSGADPQVVFSDNGVDKEHTLIDRLRLYRPHYLLSIKIIVAHLAMLDAINKSAVTEHTRNRIDAYPITKSYFILCLKQLEELKSTRVYGTVTMFKLLHESEKKLLTYARNQELIDKFDKLMNHMAHLEIYFVKTLKKRIDKSVDRATLEAKVTSTIEALTGFCTDTCYIVVYKIISFMNRQDLDNLLQIKMQ